MDKEKRYEEIVRKFADKDGEFFRHFSNVMRKYRPMLTADGISDLYQDTFLAAWKNLMEGRVKENTSWNSYLISIGLNLATHEYRKFGQLDEISDEKEDEDEELEVYNTPEVQRIFGEVLDFMKEKCRKLLMWTLYERLSYDEIAGMLATTPESAKTQRSRCRKRLIDLVRAKLLSLGYEIE